MSYWYPVPKGSFKGSLYSTLFVLISVCLLGLSIYK